MADEQADAPANRDERVPVISLTESNTPSATPATPETPPSWSHSRSYTSPRTPGNRVEQLKNSPAASKIREKLEGLESRRSDGPSKVQERLLNLCVSYLLLSPAGCLVRWIVLRYPFFSLNLPGHLRSLCVTCATALHSISVCSSLNYDIGSRT
jgi:hypothetical protein